jgi:predicted anti-sigma-YlaC factor YlaD
MKCEEIEVYLSGYLDGELTQMDQQPVENHLRSCPDCRSLLEKLRQAKMATQGMEIEQLSEKDWKIMEARVLERIGQRLGWSILIVWLVVTAVYTLYQYGMSPNEPLFEKILVFSLFLGFGLLFLSVLSQRLRERRTDRYKGVCK